MAQAFEIRGNLCNLCGYEGPDFQLRGHSHPVLYEQEVIGSQRRPVDCPKCKSSDRDRLCFSFLQNAWLPSTSPSLLHIAPEKSLSRGIRQLLEDKNKSNQWNGYQYHGLDKRTGLYRYPAWVRNGDILALPFEDHTFDLIIANHVLEHIRDLTTALQELQRVLKPNSLLIAQVPWAQELEKSSLSPSINVCKRAIWQRKNHGQYDHQWLFGQDLIHLMAKENFRAQFWKEPEASSLCVNTLEALMVYKN